MTDCRTCIHTTKDKCDQSNKMTVDEYEDWFIDKVGKCPYYKKGKGNGQSSKKDN